MNKKIIISIITILMLGLCSNSYALTTLYETTNIERVSSGVILKNFNRLTEKGWLNINMLEVNLNDKYTSVGILNSENGLNTFQTVLEMAKSNESIAAINGDFFSGTSVNGYTVGLSVSDGKMLTSTYNGNENKNEFASFVLDESGNAYMDYFKNIITLKSNDTNEILYVKEFNKPSSNYDTRPAIYTSDWGEKSIGSFSYLPITEMVVENNVVKEIRYNLEGAEIPKNGYVLATTGANAEFINNNFKVGTKVDLEINLEIDLEKIQTAISGGAILVKNGEIPTFSSNISGTHPRTAIGLSKDGNTLYLITVDGRQKKSIGVTQTELAELLIEKGIYNAINLDGGGSTTMVAQKLGDTALSIINSPSSGTLRKVTNALGIFNASKKSSLSNLIIEIPEDNVFAECSMDLKVKGYDKYYNPVEISMDDIKWSTSGVSGKVEDGKLIAGADAGTITLTAKKGKISTSINVDILSSPNEITMYPKNSYIQKNENVKFDITAKNKNGYYASIKNEELTWEVVSGDGEFKDGRFYPSSDGINIISVSRGNAKAYAVVEVAGTKEEKYNLSKNQNYTFVSYPSEVTGSISKLNQDFIQISYDFSKTDKTRAAYLRFNEPITLNENALEISLDVLSPNTISEYIKLKLVDSNGETKLVMAKRGFDASEKEETLTIPLNNISLPAKLTDIYVGQDTKDILSNDIINIGNLKVVYKVDSINTDIDVPKDIKGVDVANKPSSLSGDSITKLAVLDEFSTEKTLLDRLNNTKLQNSINENATFLILTSKDGNTSNPNITIPTLKKDAYKFTSYDKFDLITFDVTNGGIRTTDYNQWINIQNDIKNSKNKNIIVLMNGSLDNLTDSRERKLFIDGMCQLRRDNSKNILILSDGAFTDYSMERGIRYLSMNSSNYDKLSPIEVAQNSEYLLITIDSNNNLTYEIKKVF